MAVGCDGDMGDTVKYVYNSGIQVDTQLDTDTYGYSWIQ